jgi:hypothetical protein
LLALDIKLRGVTVSLILAERVEHTVNTSGIGAIRGCLCLFADVDRGVWMNLSLVHCPGAA